MNTDTLARIQPSHRAGAVCGLASAKERIPSPWVRRDRLHARLQGATKRRVTIVTGPPGSGKTALVAGWASSYDAREVLWLSAPRDIAPLMSTPSDAASCADGDDRPFLVVVDDIHLISDRRTAATLESWAEQLPGHFRVVLIGRHVGSISRARLRLHTPISEVTGAELEFTPEEADVLLAAFGVRLESEALNVLVRETHGWAAGLRLAAVLMSDSSDNQNVARALNSVGGPFWDYIEAEVLPELEAGELDALTRASAAYPLPERLCGALTDRTNVLSLFEALAARNLFITKSLGRFDLHPVFAQYLRHRLEMADRSVMVDVHLRAAEFMKEEGAPEIALHHYVRAKRYDKAIDLAATELVRSLTSGNIARGSALLPGDIPDLYFAQDPARMYLLCASLIWGSRLSEAQRCLARLKISLDSSPASNPHRVRVEWLGALCDSATLDAEGVLDHLERANDLLSSGSTSSSASSPTVDPGWLVALDNAVRSALPPLAARAHAVAGRVDTASEFLDTDPGSHGLPLGPLRLGPSAAVAMARGHLREAAALASEGICTSGECAESSLLAVESRVVLAGVLFERDDLKAARLELLEARQIAERFGLVRWTALADCDIARLLLAEGQPNRALIQLQAIRQSEIGFGMLDFRLNNLEFDCRLALHDIDGAQQLLDSNRRAAEAANNIIRLHLHAGRSDKAAAALHRAPSHFYAMRDEIEHLLLQTRILLFSGDTTAAEHVLRRAIERGRTERFVRVFLEQPGHVLETLNRINTQHDDYVEEILTKFRSMIGRQTPAPFHIIEPLTDRERELIAYLPSHLTQSEIARRMYISANTVKTHMKGLYRKLGVQSRYEAVERAQLCGLI